jgi:tetratricopeptide (TPR) repeat protein
MNKKIWIYRLTIILCAFYSCTDKKQSTKNTESVPRECVVLNDSAFKYITKYNFQREPKNLDTALYLLEKAVSCDPGYFVAYSNMANTYNVMKNYKAEIETLNKMLAIGKNNWWISTRKGVAFQKLNEVDSATKTYFFADSLCNAEMKKKPEDVNLIINYIMFKTISFGKNAGIQELNRQIEKHPELRAELINKANL